MVKYSCCIFLYDFQFFGWVGGRGRHLMLIGLIVGCMSVQGVANVKQQWSIMGEFSNVPLEEMVEWINHNTQSSKFQTLNFIHIIYSYSAEFVGG